MKVYRIGMFENPTTDSLLRMESIDFAHFSAVGTWSRSGTACPSCGMHNQRCVPPLLIQWEPSSDVVGDFSWDGPFGSVFAVQEQVAAFLRAKRFECDFHPVDYVPPEPTREPKCVSFPYEGPTLLWGLCETFVDLDMEASGVGIRECCSVCGSVRYAFCQRDIVIRSDDWHGEKMFRITTNGKSVTTFVTQEGRTLIEDAKLSNIAFSEAGQIVD